MKKIIITILMFLLLVGIASAATVQFDPYGVILNNSYVDSTTIVPGFNVSGNQSSYKCLLYSNINDSGIGPWGVKRTDLTVFNNTNTNFSALTGMTEIIGTKYQVNLFCNTTGDVTGDWLWGTGENMSLVSNATAGGWNFSVDATAPTVVINAPSSNGVWYNDNKTIRFNLSVVDNNAASCILDTNLNTSSNRTGVFTEDIQTVTYTTATSFNFTSFNSSNSWYPDNGTNYYFWRYRCNDSAGNWANLSGNYTFHIDTIAPTAFDFNLTLFRTDNRQLQNATNATDYTPQIGYSATTEINFSRYEIYFYENNYHNTTYVNTNVTSRTQLAENISTLVGDTSDYKILITAVDLAGNRRNITTLAYTYGTDSTNRALASGWNVIGNPGDNMSLSNIMNWTGATTVSIWNGTHQWQSHVSGGSNGGTIVSAGNPVLIYVASSTTFSDLIWNTTIMTTKMKINLSNQTSDDWNLVMNRNYSSDKTFQMLDNELNTAINDASQNNTYANVTFFSMYNNTASAGSKYIPYVANLSISNNNNTKFTFGECIWLYPDDTAQTNIHASGSWHNYTNTEIYQQVDWGLVS